MATLLQINSGIVGSTGNIMLAIDQCAKKAGMNTYIASVKNKTSRDDYPPNHISIGTIVEKHIHRKFGTVTGMEGGFSYFATKRFLKRLDDIKPDIIHLHNLHWSYINIELLFKYLKVHADIMVVWTLHDCWSYTGHCPYYDMSGCEKWKTKCDNCSEYKQYPVSYVDNSRRMHDKKKQWFLGLPNLVIVTPSQWLNEEIKESFLKDYEAYIISNGIDTKTFVPKESQFKYENGLEEKFVILGIAYSWGKRKGFDVFIELSKYLDERFQIIMVGGFTTEQESQCDQHGIEHYPRTASKHDLVDLYSACDVFFNPTREEMFGLVNIEAEACGTPVITFRSGGSPECIGEGCGYVIEKDDIKAAMDCIMALYENKGKPIKEQTRAWAEKFEESKTYQQYIQLYQNLMQ